MAKFTKVNEELLAEQIEDQIYDMIVSENYQTGDKIPSENKLSVRFNVGRSTIREAIKILVSRNVLTTVRGSGTYVKNIIPSDMDPLNLRELEDRLPLAMDLVELRMMLEPGVAELAAIHATDAQVQKLEEICQSYEGVEKSYAVQAGREIRIMVQPEVINDEKMVLVARQIAKQILEPLEEFFRKLDCHRSHIACHFYILLHVVIILN